MFLEKLFQKNKKSDMEKYKEEKEKADSGQALKMMEELINRVPDDVVYTKQTEAGTYVFANYWNDGTLIMYDPEGDNGEYISRKIKLTYNLNKYPQEMIEVLLKNMKALLKEKKDVLCMLSELQELDSYISDLFMSEKYAIYKEMGQTEEFMDAYLDMFVAVGKKIVSVGLFSIGVGLFSNCMEAVLYEGNVEYAVKKIECFLELFRNEKNIWNQLIESWFWIYLIVDVDNEEQYIRHYTEFKKLLSRDGYLEFVSDLEKQEDWREKEDSEEAQKAGKMRAIVEIFKENPILAMEQWIAMVKEKEANKEMEQWQRYLCSDFFNELWCEFGSNRGFVLFSREFMKHEEWFPYLVYAREDAYDLGDNLVKLRINGKYEQQIDRIVELLHNEWNEEEWEKFKKGYEDLTYEACAIEKDTLEQFVEEDTYLELHKKHFQEMFSEDL